MEKEFQGIIPLQQKQPHQKDSRNPPENVVATKEMISQMRIKTLLRPKRGNMWRRDAVDTKTAIVGSRESRTTIDHNHPIRHVVNLRDTTILPGSKQRDRVHIHQHQCHTVTTIETLKCNRCRQEEADLRHRHKNHSNHQPPRTSSLSTEFTSVQWTAFKTMVSFPQFDPPSMQCQSRGDARAFATSTTCPLSTFAASQISCNVVTLFSVKSPASLVQKSHSQ
mmetsp:Transcript_9280/g.34334  ORF Transcript_9280/g.34334 Transcript_9280/m.34334 type:complete len:223 (+) Transcript_9280:520-1188(+)